jgi:hypothetical protein
VITIKGADGGDSVAFGTQDQHAHPGTPRNGSRRAGPISPPCPDQHHQLGGLAAPRPEPFQARRCVGTRRFAGFKQFQHVAARRAREGEALSPCRACWDFDQGRRPSRTRTIAPREHATSMVKLRARPSSRSHRSARLIGQARASPARSRCRRKSSRSLFTPSQRNISFIPILIPSLEVRVSAIVGRRSHTREGTAMEFSHLPTVGRCRLSHARAMR